MILRYNFSLSDFHFSLIFLLGEVPSLLPTVRAQLEPCVPCCYFIVSCHSKAFVVEILDICFVNHSIIVKKYFYRVCIVLLLGHTEVYLFRESNMSQFFWYQLYIKMFPDPECNG